MLYIRVDLETSVVKLLLMGGSGRIHRVVPREYPLYSPRPGWSEQNPEGWSTVSVDDMKELALECDKLQVADISFGDQMHDLVTLDEVDEVIRPAILWNDGRSGKETDYLNQNTGKDKLSAYTASTAFTGFMAPKILWMKKNEPENFTRVRRIMFPEDYLAYRLSGSFCTDHSDASGMLLLGVTHERWPKEMVEMCGVTRKQLPDLYKSHQMVGNLKEELTKELGLTQDARIIAGAGDNTAAAVGTGTVGEGCCNVSLETSGIIFTSSESFKMSYNNALHSFDHVDGHFHLIGCMLDAASCNRWWTEEIPKTKEFSKEQEGIVRLGENRVFYLPYLVGERSSHNDPRARACLIGMTMDISREEMTQAVLEGMMFGLRNSLEMARSLGIRIDRTRICGEGAKSPLWKKMIANIMNVKVDVVESEEDPTLGDVILAAVGCGEYPDVKTAADSIVRVIETTESDADLVERYEKQYGRFRQMYSAFRTAPRNLEEQHKQGAGYFRPHCMAAERSGVLGVGLFFSATVLIVHCLARSQEL